MDFERNWASFEGEQYEGFEERVGLDSCNNLEGLMGLRPLSISWIQILMEKRTSRLQR